MKIIITGDCDFAGLNLAIYLKENLKNSKIYSLNNLFRKRSEIN
jgi:nucleoside-diphosphate-sugar epimerase